MKPHDGPTLKAKQLGETFGMDNRTIAVDVMLHLGDSLQLHSLEADRKFAFSKATMEFTSSPLGGHIHAVFSRRLPLVLENV